MTVCVRCLFFVCYGAHQNLSVLTQSFPTRRSSERVDGRYIDEVGVVEGALDVVHRVAKAGVAVGLDDGDHATLGAFPGGGQGGFDLDRMMAVTVDDGDALDLADLGETALDAVELVESVGEDFVRNSHLQGKPYRGQRVLAIVAPRHRHAPARD